MGSSHINIISCCLFLLTVNTAFLVGSCISRFILWILIAWVILPGQWSGDPLWSQCTLQFNTESLLTLQVISVISWLRLHTFREESLQIIFKIIISLSINLFLHCSYLVVDTLQVHILILILINADNFDMVWEPACGSAYLYITFKHVLLDANLYMDWPFSKFCKCWFFVVSFHGDMHVALE